MSILIIHKKKTCRGALFCAQKMFVTYIYIYVINNINKMNHCNNFEVLAEEISPNDISIEKHISVDELDTEFNKANHECFICKYVQSGDNSNFRKMNTIFTENYSKMRTDILMDTLLDYYNNCIKKPAEIICDIKYPELNVDLLKDHFIHHYKDNNTIVLSMIEHNSILRRSLLSNLVSIDESGKHNHDLKKIDTLMKLEAHILRLLTNKPRQK